jgi:uncharacterized protein
MDDSSGRRSPTARLSRLAGLSDPPHRTAAAFSIGVFLSFSPFFGLQIATGLGLALALRLNRLAVFAGLCANLPWLMVPWYALTTTLGAALLGVPIAEDAAIRISGVLELPVYSALFWERALGLVRPFVWPFVLGSTLGALVVACIAYLVTSRLIMRLRESQPAG